MEFTQKIQLVFESNAIIVKIMKTLNAFCIIVVYTLFIGFICQIEALRCRSEAGVNEDEMKRIARTCMRSVGHRETDDSNGDDSNSSGEDDERDNDEDNYDDGEDDNNQGQNNRNHNNGQRTRQRYDYRRFRDDDENKQLKRQSNWENENSNNGQRNGSHRRGSNNGNMGTGRHDPNYASNNTEQDRNCMIHCFFREMKMTNNDDYPDKHKVLNVLTKEIKEKELRDFYVDSIQQCFHMVEMMNNHHKKKDKCVFTQNIVTCLTERARANCDDFAEEMMIF